MPESYIQNMFAERIGGSSFGKDTNLYKFEKIKRAKAEARQNNPQTELIDMGVGEPDEKAPDEVVQTLAEEAGKWENRTYSDNGIPEFYNAVADYMKDLYNVDVNPDTEICHSIGSKAGLTLIPTAFVNPGDMSVMTIPGYPVMGTWTKYLGGEIKELPLKKENNFLPQLEKLTEEERKKTKLLYLNYPNNPTGAAATAEFYDQVISFAKNNNILVVSDAAYAPLDFTGSPLSILSRPGGKDVAIELHSMSKGFNMTGWRLGWVCGNELAVKAYAAVKDSADSGQFRAIQKAAIRALENHRNFTPRICEKYSRRLEAMTDMLQSLGFDVSMPGGTFYLYVEIPKGTESGKQFESGEDFCRWLITEKLISTVPWDDAGNFVRFSATFPAGTREDEMRVLNEVKSRLAEEKFIF